MGYYWNEQINEPNIGRVLVSVGLAIILLIGISMYVFPIYGVWQKELSGKAQLKEAEWNRQITIKEAEAKKEAATALAAAEVERAKGVAAANKIISVSLDEQYLRYLWIQGLHDGSSEVIYIPTEANLPILEARDNRMGGG